MIRFKFNEKKAVQLVWRLLSKCGGEMDRLPLLKHIYLIDREAFEKWGRSISWDHYVCMKDGPVLSQIYDLTKTEDERDPDFMWGKGLGRIWDQHIENRKPHNVVAKSDPGDDEFSEAEIDLIDEVFEKFKGFTPSQLRNFCHDLPEYTDPAPRGRVLLPYETILKAVGRSQEQIEDLANMLNSLYARDLGY